MNSALSLYKYSTKQLRITVPDVPDTLTMTKAYLMIKNRWTDEDVDALVTLTITSSPIADGVISDTGADGTGTLEFVIAADSLEDITDLGKTYYTAIKVILSNGSAYLLPNSLMPTKIHSPAIEATS
jgi:hypothetical protein